MNGLIASVLFVGVVAYAVFGGADFGAGFWDLTAGRGAGGRASRALVERAVGPVWEANHVWLIYCLVMLWSAFPPAFAAITTTLYVPLGLAALGIVLRGSGFALREALSAAALRWLSSTVFALSSIITPFFFGAAVGGIASGRVPTGGYGDALRSWLNPTSVLGGVLAVLVCAYLAAVFLAAAARAELDAPMQLWFSRRALAAGLAAGAVSIAGIFVLHHDAPRLFHQLSRPGLPLLIASVLCGVATLELLRREKYGAARAVAALTVATVVCGWGVAQYPYLLGTHLSIAQAASPRPTLWVLLGVAFVAAVVIAPSLALLYRLQERGRLGTHG